jgi:predicted secreted protein
MAKQLGRKVTISVGGVVIAAARTKSLTINNEPVNITTDGDDGIQMLLNEPGEKAVEVSVEGLGDQAAFMDIALSDDLVEAIIFDYGTFTVTGDFFQASYSEGLPYNDSVTFTASYQSTGAVVKAASGS